MRHLHKSLNQHWDVWFLDCQDLREKMLNCSVKGTNWLFTWDADSLLSPDACCRSTPLILDGDKHEFIYVKVFTNS